MDDRSSDVGGEEAIPAEDNFIAFTGQGNRLDGKSKPFSGPLPTVFRMPPKRGIPDYDFQLGTLRFIRTQKSKDTPANDEKKEKVFEAFKGQGNSLVKKK